MIYINNDVITIQNYQKLLKVSEDEIVFILFKKTIFISGKNLSISYFEKSEFQINGQINSINFND